MLQPPTLDPSIGPRTFGKAIALGEFCQQSWQYTGRKAVWAQMVITTGPDLGDQPHQNWGLQRYAGHRLPQSPSVAALAPGSPQLLSPLPTFSQILTPNHHPQDPRFPSPGHLPSNPQPAGSENDLLSRVAADSPAKRKIAILGRGQAPNLCL